MSLFEKASRMKLRFDSSVGMINAEDLWDVPLGTLDEIAKSANRSLKRDEEESFVVRKPKSGPDQMFVLGFEIVKYVIKVRLDEAEAALHTKELQEKKQKIMALIAKKEDAAFETVGIEELRAMLEEL